MNRTRTLMPLLAAVFAAALAGCGSGSGSATAANTPASTQSPAGGGVGPGAGVRTPPGAFGKAAAVAASSLEVQNSQTGQTTVNFTGSTKFRRIESVTLSAITVGSCVTATSSSAANGNALTARSVGISAPVKGSCTGQRGQFGPGGFGGQRARSPGGRPTSRPTVRPSRSPRFAGGATATGTVTAVSGSSFTVRGFVHTFLRSASPRPTASPTTRTVTVTVTSSTTYSRTVTATHTALKVGQCITALGKADDTGAVTATSITISAPVNGNCFGGASFRRPGSAGGANA